MLLFFAALLACVSGDAVINLDIGDIHGRDLGASWEFLGVPYATAERWKPPVTLVHTQLHNGVFNATTGGPCCYQLNLGPSDPANPETYKSAKECLNMNIFTPHNSSQSQKKFPVMVFSHGGGEVEGCSQDSVPHLYNGTNLIRGASDTNKVIVIVINYRLWVFGRLYLSALAREDPSWPTAGNYDILDHQAALKWVQTHIAKFGGDPSRVTVFGQSAGGIYAQMLPPATGSEGLFNGIISESGHLAGFTNVKDAEAIGMKFVSGVGCDKYVGNDTQLLACMRNITPKQFLALKSEFFDIYWKGTVIDGHVYTKNPHDWYVENTPKLNVMLGGTFPDAGAYCNQLLGYDWDIPMLPSLREQFIQGAYSTFTQRYPLLTNNTDFQQQLSDAYGFNTCDTVRRCCQIFTDAADDWQGYCYSRRLLSHLAKANMNTYMFVFTCHTACNFSLYNATDPVPRSVVPCLHAAELPYLFNTESSDYPHNDLPCPFDEVRKKYATDVIQLWTQFAYTGQPTNDNSWHPYRCGQEAYYNISMTTPFHMHPYTGNGNCDLYDRMESLHDFYTYGKSAMPLPTCQCNATAAAHCQSFTQTDEDECQQISTTLGCYSYHSCQTKSMIDDCHSRSCGGIWGC